MGYTKISVPYIVFLNTSSSFCCFVIFLSGSVCYIVFHVFFWNLCLALFDVVLLPVCCDCPDLFHLLYVSLPGLLSSVFTPCHCHIVFVALVYILSLVLCLIASCIWLVCIFLEFVFCLFSVCLLSALSTWVRLLCFLTCFLLLLGSLCTFNINIWTTSNKMFSQ